MRDHNLGTIRPGRSFTQEELDHFARRCGFSAGQMPDPIGLPQPPQNLAKGSLVKPQFAHAPGSAAPHWAQKRLVAAFSAMQLGQRI